MDNLIKSVDGILMTTSKVIADTFGKKHRDVMRDIAALKCSDDFRVRNFAQSYYVSSQNKNIQCYDITRDGFTILCMGFTGEKAMAWKEKYIDAFNKMERGLLNIDSRMTKLTIEGRKIEECGKEWSSFGHEIRRQKKAHLASSKKLLGDVQLALEI